MGWNFAYNILLQQNSSEPLFKQCWYHPGLLVTVTINGQAYPGSCSQMLYGSLNVVLGKALILVL